MVIARIETREAHNWRGNSSKRVDKYTLCHSVFHYHIFQVFNASEEIAKAAAYPHVRLFTAALITSNVALDELQEVEQNWTVGSPGELQILLVA